MSYALNGCGGGESAYTSWSNTLFVGEYSLGGGGEALTLAGAAIN